MGKCLCIGRRHINIGRPVNLMQKLIWDCAQLDDIFSQSKFADQQCCRVRGISPRIFSSREFAGEEQPYTMPAKLLFEQWQRTYQRLKISIVVVVADEEQL